MTGQRSISFSWTTPAIRARHKSVTRRDWKDSYARTFKEGEIIIATDRQPRFGGKEIGKIRLTHAPYQESEFDMPDEDYEGEGFAFLDEHPEFKPKRWQGVNLREHFEEFVTGAQLYGWSGLRLLKL